MTDRTHVASIAIGAVLLACAVAFVAGAPPSTVVPLLVVATIAWAGACARPPRSATLVLIVAIALRAVFLVSDGHSDDVHRYVLDGRMVLAGIDPYAIAPRDPAAAPARTPTSDRVNHAHLPTIYPPLAQAFFASTAALGLEEVGVKNVVLGLDVGVVLLLLAWLRATKRPIGWVVLYAWSPLAVGAAARGHVDALMLLPLVGFLWAYERGAYVRAAVLLGLSILAKLVPVLLLPFLFVRHRKAAALAVAVVLAGYLPFALRGDASGSLLPFATEFSFHAALPRVLGAFLPDGAVRPLLATLLATGTLAIAIAEPRAPRALLFTMGWLYLLSPTVHLWYLTWGLVALPGIGPNATSLPLLAFCAAILGSVPTYLDAHLGAPFVEHGLRTAFAFGVPFVVTAVLLVRHRPRLAALAPATAPLGPLPTFSVLIPARGERKNLEALLPRWLAAGATDVVVADTPTGDGTEALVARFPRARYVRVDARGYGAAVSAAWRTVTAESPSSHAPVFALVVADADDPAAPDAVGALLAPLHDPRVGMVTGARIGGRLRTAQRYGNRLACALLAASFGRRFRDLGPLRAWRTTALRPDDVLDVGYGWNVELNVRVLERGLEVVEVPVTPAPRPHGVDTISGTWRGVLRAGRGILGRLFALREAACARRS